MDCNSNWTIKCGTWYWKLHIPKRNPLSNLNWLHFVTILMNSHLPYPPSFCFVLTIVSNSRNPILSETTFKKTKCYFVSTVWNMKTFQWRSKPFLLLALYPLPIFWIASLLWIFSLKQLGSPLSLLRLWKVPCLQIGGNFWLWLVMTRTLPIDLPKSFIPWNSQRWILGR